MKRTALLLAAALLLPSTVAVAGEETTSSAREAGQLGQPQRRAPNVVVRPGPMKPINPDRGFEPRRPPPPIIVDRRPPPPPRWERDRRPPVIYIPSAPRVGWTCETPRFECDLSRPQPLGDDCWCRSPSGARRSGIVIP